MKKYGKRLVATLLLTALTVALLQVTAGASPKISTAICNVMPESELVKTGKNGEDVYFSENDFCRALGVSSIDSVTVTSLPNPDDGVLRLSGIRVSEGQLIKREYMSLLRFVPAGELTKNAEFAVTVSSVGGDTDMNCSVRMAETVGSAPKVGSNTSLSVYTQKSISLFGRMEATDPDGDAIRFEIASYPKKGILTVTDTATGDFRYTPGAGYTGSDAFSYVARDEYGNYSEIATVTIEVDDRRSELVFADMTEHPQYLAALSAVENGIMSASESDTGTDVFLPDDIVSRADFVVSVMKTAGIQTLSYGATSFDDNGDIPSYAIPYIATAQAYGYVNGVLTEDGLMFQPTEAITLSDAATLICSVFRLIGDDTTLEASAFSSDFPVYARPSVMSLSRAGIPIVGDFSASDRALTRAEIALILTKMFTK